MTFSSRTLYVIRVSPVVFFFIFTAYLFSGPAGYWLSHIVSIPDKKEAFVDSALRTEIDGPFSNRTLVELCRSREWTAGLIFKCEAVDGGIGNVRNMLLNCVRYAIEAGATGFIVPEIRARGSDLTNIHTDDLVPLTHFFDLNHFTTSLTTSCPQIHLYSHINDLWDKPSTSEPVNLSAEKLSTSFIADAVLANPANWSAAFESYLDDAYPRQFSAEEPVLVVLDRALLQFPLSYDEPKLVANFGRILRFREDVRRLAATVLYALSTKHSLSLHTTSSIEAGKFYGAHLRTAVDAQAAHWTPFSTQSSNYLSQAALQNLSTIYLASGNPSDVDLFTVLASNISIAVETKQSLLGGDLSSISDEYGNEIRRERHGAKGFEAEWGVLNDLTWDQQGLVDYEVLLRSSNFGGIWESSFSWNVAMRRHVSIEGGTWIPLPPGPRFEDAASIIFGPRERRESQRFELSMWP